MGNYTFSEMENVIEIAELHFWPKKISTKKWPKNDPKLPIMAQNLALAKKNCKDISPVSPTFCISAKPLNPHLNLAHMSRPL